MKTLKFVFIALFLAVMAGCEMEVQVDETSVTERTECGSLSVSLSYDDVVTKGDLTDIVAKIAEETAVNSISVLVFDKVTEQLNAYDTMTAYTDVCEMTVPVGEKIVYAMVNGPSVSDVTSLSGMLALVDDISQRSMERYGLTLVGQMECEVTTDTEATPVIPLKWMVSRVVLSKISCQLPAQYGAMTVNCIYLGNANTVQTFAGEVSSMVNPDGYADAEKTTPIERNNQGSCAEYMFRLGQGDINVGSYSSKLYRMYCQPSTEDKMTCMYIVATIGGINYYYRIPLTQGLKAGATCSVEVTIKNLGSLLPPDGDFLTGDIATKIYFQDWEPGAAYDSEF